MSTNESDSLTPLSIRSGMARIATATVIGHASSALIGVVSIRIFTQLAAPHVFGNANLILNFVILTSAFLISPVTNTQLRYHSAAENRDGFTRTVLTFALGIAVASCAIAAVAFAGLRLFHRAPVGIGVALLAGALLVFKTSRDVLVNKFGAERRQVTYMTLLGVESLSSAAFTALLLLAAPTVASYVGGQVLGFLAVTCAALLPLGGSFWRRDTADRRVAGSFVQQLRRYGAPFAPVAALTWVSNIADRYVLAVLLGSTAVGLYAAPFSIGSRVCILLSTATVDIFRPMLFNAANRGDERGARRVFLAWVFTYSAVTIAGVLGLWIFGNLLTHLLLAPAYRAGALRLIMIVAIGFGLFGANGIIDNRLMSMHYSSRLIPSLAVGAFTNVALSFYLIPRLGITGAALASSGSYLAQFTTNSIILAASIARRTAATAGESQRAAPLEALSSRATPIPKVAPRRASDALRMLFVSDGRIWSSGRGLREALRRRRDCLIDDIALSRARSPHDSLLLRIGNRALGPLYRDELENQISASLRGFDPEIIVIYKGAEFGADFLRKLQASGRKLVNVFPDLSPLFHGNRLKASMGVYDLVISTKPFHPDIWNSAYGYTNRCVFVPHGYDPELHLYEAPVTDQPIDVAIAAMGRSEYHQLVLALAEQPIMADLNVVIAGDNWSALRPQLPRSWNLVGPVFGRSYPTMVRKAKIVVAPVQTIIGGPPQPGDVDSTRTYELAASYTFFIHRMTPYIGRLYDPGTEVPFYERADDLADLIRGYLPSQDRRAKMARAAHRRAVPAYSLDERAAEIMAYLLELSGRPATWPQRPPTWRGTANDPQRA